MKTTDWLTVAEDRDNQETREVYALAGLALYMAQVLEHGIVNSLVGIRRIEWLKSKPPGAESLNLQIDRLWEDNFRLTLGQLIRSIALLTAGSFSRRPTDRP